MDDYRYLLSSQHLNNSRKTTWLLFFKFQHLLMQTVSSPKANQAVHMSICGFLSQIHQHLESQVLPWCLPHCSRGRQSPGTVFACLGMSANVCKYQMCANWHDATMLTCLSLSRHGNLISSALTSDRKCKPVELCLFIDDVSRRLKMLWFIIWFDDIAANSMGSSSWNLSGVSRESGESWSGLSHSIAIHVIHAIQRSRNMLLRQILHFMWEH